MTLQHHKIDICRKQLLYLQKNTHLGKVEGLSLLFDATVDELGIHTLISQDLLSGLGRTERIGLRTGRGRLLRGGNSLGRARLKLHGHNKAITSAGINTKGLEVRDGPRTSCKKDTVVSEGIGTCAKSTASHLQTRAFLRRTATVGTHSGSLTPTGRRRGIFALISP